MSPQTVRCQGCSALLEVGAPGRYRCPACGLEFRHEPVPPAPEAQPLTHGGYVYRGPDSSAPAVIYEPEPGKGPQPGQPPPLGPQPPPQPQHFPMPGAPHGQVEPAPIEQRERYGFWGGLVRTFWLTVVDPVGFFRRLDPRPGYGPALLYALLLAGTGKLVARLFSYLQYKMMPLAQQDLEQFRDVFAGLGGLGQQVAQYLTPEFIERSNLINLLVAPLLAPLSLLAALLLTALLMHACVAGFNPRNFGFNATLRVCCFSYGVGLLLLLPLIGPLISLAWISTLQVIGLTQVQRLSYGQALLAWLLPAALMCCLIC